MNKKILVLVLTLVNAVAYSPVSSERKARIVRAIRNQARLLQMGVEPFGQSFPKKAISGLERLEMRTDIFDIRVKYDPTFPCYNPDGPVPRLTREEEGAYRRRFGHGSMPGFVATPSACGDVIV